MTSITIEKLDGGSSKKSAEKEIPKPIPKVEESESEESSEEIEDIKEKTDDTQPTTPLEDTGTGTDDESDYTASTEEFDVTKEGLYQILGAVLEDDEGTNITEKMGEINKSLEKIVEQNESQAKYLKKMNENFERHNKNMEQIVKLFRDFVESQVEEEENNNN